MTSAQNIKQKALQLGFDLVGITDASPLNNEQFKAFTNWLDSGYAGRMDYMQDNLDKRTNPAKLLKNAQSIICLGLNYNPPKTQKQISTPAAPLGIVVNYAQYEDYHPFIKKRLRKLTDFISSVAGAGFSFKICVDSAPLAERAFAARAGLGFIGKNHMLINPELGPQLLLGEIVTSLKLQTDEPIKADCQGCNKCRTACPTGALRTDGRFDANKCISYLTIEHKDQIPADLAQKIGDRIFGCNECVLACPYQTNAPVCKNKHFRFFDDRANLNLYKMLSMSEDDFEAKFADSVFMRLGLDRLKRNAQICLNNISR
ncbi:MAG: tRNA epoxyqueuosine(34) reductase QueG [Sedimentisphaerales bacterium]